MNFRERMEKEFSRTTPSAISSEALRDFLLDSVMTSVRAVISQIVEVQDSGPPRATDAADKPYSEFGHGIEFPESIGAEGRTVIAAAFAAATMRWLADMSGVRHIHEWRGPKIALLTWRVEPEFDVQHTQVPAPVGYAGETFRDFLYDTDTPYCWGPWVAKLYMRGSIAGVSPQ